MFRKVGFFKNPELKYVYSVVQQKLEANFYAEINPHHSPNIHSKIYYLEKSNTIIPVINESYSCIGNKKLDAQDIESLQLILMLRNRELLWMLLVLIGGMGSMMSGGLFISGANDKAAKVTTYLSVLTLLFAMVSLCYNEYQKEVNVQELSLSKEEIKTFLTHKANHTLKHITRAELDELISNCLFTIVTQNKAKELMYAFLKMPSINAADTHLTAHSIEMHHSPYAAKQNKRP